MIYFNNVLKSVYLYLYFYIFLVLGEHKSSWCYKKYKEYFLIFSFMPYSDSQKYSNIYHRKFLWMCHARRMKYFHIRVVTRCEIKYREYA